MYDVNKIIVFLFVMILLFYMLKLSFFIKQKGNSQTYTFSILFTGILLCGLATFFDMLTPIYNNKYINMIIKICFTGGAIFYISGVVLWGNYTKKIIEDFEKLALKDSMTEIFNRNGMERIYKLISEAKKPFYLGICDLDGLKGINDKFGHLEGDQYIAQAAKIIADAVGNLGYVGRIGGDEFLVFLEYIDRRKVENMADEIKQAVYNISPAKNTGISIGCAVFPDDGENLDTLMKIADKRMYQDKESRKKIRS